MSVKHVKVDHNKENRQFNATVGNERAYLNYRKKDNNTLECYETFVPKAERRQGVAAQLTEEALNYARNNNLKVQPTCPYVESFIDKHREYKDITANR